MIRNNFRRLSLEQLEGREVPTATIVQVIEMPERRVYALPGATEVVANVKITTNGASNFALLTDIGFTAAFGGGSLSSNTSGFKLMGDVDRQRSNGYEAFLAEATANHQTDVVDFNISTATLMDRSHPLRLQVVANFDWILPSNKMGVQLVKANFDDLSATPIPDSQVILWGRKPTLHALATSTLYIIQKQMPASANVHAGDSVTLAEYFMNDHFVSSAKIAFPLLRGNLGNATDYMLVHTNWVGVQDQFIPGTVVGGKVQFVLPEGFARGNWKLKAVMANVAAGSELQLAMPMNGIDIMAYDLNGRRLRGFRWNEIGGGQIQVTSHSNWSTVYTVVA